MSAIPSRHNRVGGALTERHLQAKREEGGDAERERNPGDASCPSAPIEDLAEDRGAYQAARKVTGEVDAAGGAAIRGGRTADKAGRGRLGEERAHANQDHPQQDRREMGASRSGKPAPARPRDPHKVGRVP